MAKSIVLYGPAGSGKTKLAPAIASCLGLTQVVEVERMAAGAVLHVEGVLYVAQDAGIALDVAELLGASAPLHIRDAAGLADQLPIARTAATEPAPVAPNELLVIAQRVASGVATATDARRIRDLAEQLASLPQPLGNGPVWFGYDPGHGQDMAAVQEVAHG
ncbi:hypothetical protein [Pseudoxanthomonas winnipegensis]|uniref:Parvovirus non-structural protein 1 helicase domain-containing protein n=1 Tax=Pseudoxanthomonas winnipegensis TaxID=2480810 RepID=A0A4Q8LCE5_9GAMM|nr:hypothetical protein [Pseudoxanthomonas winnipegensis]TAA26544.1 hypothetical protein EA660_04745 [Pseudoxanthomonas winnipegensis]